MCRACDGGAIHLDDNDGRYRHSSEVARELIAAYITTHRTGDREVWEFTSTWVSGFVADLAADGSTAELWRMFEALTFMAAAGWEELSELATDDPLEGFAMFCQAVELSGMTGYCRTPAEASGEAA